MQTGKALKHNRKKNLEDKRLLFRFIKQVYSAHDTPSLIKLVARDDDYLVLCSAIVNAGQNDTKTFFLGLFKECHRQGFDIYSMQGKLKPVAGALGLVIPSGIQMDYYDLLGITPDADTAKIRKAYRELARKTHPDTSKGTQRDNQTFAELNEAYKTLIDPDLRYQYEQSRHNLGLWSEQAGRPLKKKKRIRHIFQIGIILIFFVFAAYISDIVFQEKAITNDPYSGMEKNNNRTKDKQLAHNREMEVQDRQRDFAGKHDVSKSSDKYSKARELLHDKYNRKKEPSHFGVKGTEFKKNDNPVFLEASRGESEKDEPVEDKLMADHFRPGISVLKQQKDLDRNLKMPNPNVSQKNLFFPANVKRIPSGVHSEQLAQEDVHVIRRGSSSSAGSSQDISVVLPVLESGDITPESAQKKKLAEPRKKLLKQIAAKKESEGEKELGSKIEAFLHGYCHEYENRNLAGFARFFSQHAIEMGKPFTKLLAKYQQNFQTLDNINYHIKLKKYFKDTSTGNIVVNGNFSLKWRMNDGMLKESAGDISMMLYENGDSLLIKKLDYNFKR